MTISEAITALPTGGDASSAALRNFLVKRVIYPLGDAEDPTAFDALDADTGAIPQGLAWQSIIYWLDPADTTSAHDGTTVLVTNDGYRYKIPEYAGLVLSVLDADLTAPPDEPEANDAYLVPAGATGDWSGKADKVAVFTARGWKFVDPAIGRILHVEDEDAYYHYAATGEWVAGFGDTLLSTASVVPANLLGGRTRWIVEDQTTNDPPSSPADGVQYIIGPAPTGDWSGDAGKLAIARNGAWIVVTPGEGYEAFDKSLGVNYVYRSSAWQSAAGSYVSRYSDSFDALTAVTIEHDGSLSTTTTIGYAYSSSTAPTSTASVRAIDTYQPSIAAKKAGAIFELDIWGRLAPAVSAPGGGTQSVTLSAIAVFVDSETTAREWLDVPESITDSAEKSLLPKKFTFTLADTAAHTIKVRYFGRLTVSSGGGTRIFSLSARNRRIIIREAA